MENIKYHVSGFLSKSEYSAYFYQYFITSEKLRLLEEVTVYLYEDPIVGTNKSRSTTINFTKDGEACKIRIPFALYYIANKLSAPPAPKEVFDIIDQVLSAADEQYRDEFI